MYVVTFPFKQEPEGTLDYLNLAVALVKVSWGKRILFSLSICCSTSEVGFLHRRFALSLPAIVATHKVFT